jgi:LysR family hydrogen peroxide-inducible transcriptional activator
LNVKCFDAQAAMDNKTLGKEVGFKMQLRDIEYVVAIANFQSFSKAAESLYISQPALSQAVQRLEKKLGTKLFIRNTGTIQMTYAGEVLYNYGSQMLQLKQNIIQQIKEIDETESQQLRIGMSQFLSKYLAPDILNSFHILYPKAELYLVEDISDILEDMLMRFQIDLAIIPFKRNNRNFFYLPLITEEVLLATHKDFCIPGLPMPEKEPPFPLIDVSLLDDQKFILQKKGQFMHSLASNLFHEAHIMPKTVIETRNCESVLSFINKGLGIGFISDEVRVLYTEDHNIRFYRINSSLARRNAIIAWNNNSHLSMSAKKFIEIVQEKCSAIQNKLLPV